MALTTFSDLVQEARERVKLDTLTAGLPDDGKRSADGGTGATAYADAVAVYLAFALRQADRLLNDHLHVGAERRTSPSTRSDGKLSQWCGTSPKSIRSRMQVGNF